ncbi:hypothetical protein TNCV_2550811 [Trichonephila clavipes]|nr:hypothetical protein TNCV_2550811 [Trichonephila clavipes]
MKFIPGRGWIFMPVVNRNLEHHTGDSKTFLGSTPILKKSNCGVVRRLPLLFPSTNLTREGAARRLFRVPPCRKGIIHLQTSLPSPGFELKPYALQSVSLITVQDWWLI